MDPGSIPLIDFHTHIGDVCRGCYQEETTPQVHGVIQPHILERTHYNPLLLHLSASPVIPKFLLLKPAKQAASLANGNNLVASMDSLGVKKSLILPIAPFVTTAQVLEAAQSSSDRLVPLMSVDFDVIAPHEVETQIKTFCDLYPFRGIKFHPNLQKVDPSSQKARVLYETAAAKGLFVLMHGGITPILYDDSRKFAVGKHLLPVLKEYSKTTFVVAHAGGYFNPDEGFLKNIVDLPNVYVDTSGVGPGVILTALNLLGPNRIIFGSDWPYSTQGKSIKIARKAISQYSKNDDHVCGQTLERVFEQNARGLLKC